MSDETPAGDKEHEPTQKKLEDARKKGEVARSAELATAAAYGGFLIAAVVAGPATLIALGAALMAPLARADRLAQDVFARSAAPFAGRLLGAVVPPLLPWFLMPALLALLAFVAQKGLLFTPSRLQPKLSRISPLQTFKQKFGRSGLFEFVKSFVKLCLYSTILGLYLASQMPRMLGALHLGPGLVAVELGRLTLGLLGIVLVIALAVGLIDLIWQRSEFLRRNRMSRKELLDEMKSSEGDPQMKQQRRQKAISIAMNQMLAEVPGADVVIVNPTHYAVALKWDRGKERAPRCVAKGVDEIAARIREIAREHAIPIHSDPPTARALHAAIELGQEIHPDHYRAVAAAIRFADRIRRKARSR